MATAGKMVGVGHNNHRGLRPTHLSCVCSPLEFSGPVGKSRSHIAEPSEGPHVPLLVFAVLGLAHTVLLPGTRLGPRYGPESLVLVLSIKNLQLRRSEHPVRAQGPQI